MFKLHNKVYWPTRSNKPLRIEKAEGSYVLVLEHWFRADTGVQGSSSRFAANPGIFPVSRYQDLVEIYPNLIESKMQNTFTTFSPGDRVYIPEWSNRILVLDSYSPGRLAVNSLIGANRKPLVLMSNGKISKYADVNSSVFLATMDNFKKLVKLYPSLQEPSASSLDRLLGEKPLTSYQILQLLNRGLGPMFNFAHPECNFAWAARANVELDDVLEAFDRQFLVQYKVKDMLTSLIYIGIADRDSGVTYHLTTRDITCKSLTTLVVSPASKARPQLPWS